MLPRRKRQFPHQTSPSCFREGLVGGEAFAVDAKSDQGRMPSGRNGSRARRGCHQKRPFGAVEEYMALLDNAAFGAATDVVPKFVSPADPVARWTGAHGGQAFFAYSTNYLVDVDHSIILNVEDDRDPAGRSCPPHPRSAEEKDIKTELDAIARVRYGGEACRVRGLFHLGMHELRAALTWPFPNKRDPRTLALRQKVEETGAQAVIAWPSLPTKTMRSWVRSPISTAPSISSCATWRRRWISKACCKRLGPGKTSKLMANGFLDEAIEVLADLDRLEQVRLEGNREPSARGTSSLTSSCADFHDDDAFVFMTKSAIDYKRVFSELPDIDADALRCGRGTAASTRDP